MISSKKLTAVCVLLMIAIVAASVFIVLIPQSSADNTLYEYSDTHKISFSDEDLLSSYDSKRAEKILLSGDNAICGGSVISDNGNIKIVSGGTYEISGELYDGNITVDTADDNVVHLVFKGADINSSSGAALRILQAEKTVLTLCKDTENTLSVKNTADDAAALYSKDSVSINGDGSLIISSGVGDGIKVNDTLKLIGGKLIINAADDGINVNDILALKNTDITLDCGGDAIKCENEDASFGFIASELSRISVSCSGDAVYASSAIYINDTDISIANCYEGIEARYIEINDGDIHIISRDDGINAVGEGSSFGMGSHFDNGVQDSRYLVINGGNIIVETDGDGIDSNGSAEINGGNVTVYGPESSGNSSLDFEYSFVINGGYVFAAGSSGMAEAPSQSSSQPSLIFYLDENSPSGSYVEITDEDGNVIASNTPTKRFDLVCFSCPELSKEKNYSILIDGINKATVTVNDTITVYGSSKRRF